MSVKDLLRHYESGKCIDGYSKFTDKEKELNSVFYESQTAVHNALCGERDCVSPLHCDLTVVCLHADSIDTPNVMKHLRELVSRSNVYMTEADPPNTHLLENVALYVTKMLQVFGAVPSPRGIGYPVESQQLDVEATVLPFASLVASFREEVRQISLQEKCK